MSFPLFPLARRREEDYEFVEILGRGNFTSVHRAIERDTGRRCAVKVIERYRCTRLKKIDDVWMERHCLRRLNHPNIVKLYGHFSDGNFIFVVMEECSGGEAWELVKNIGCPEYLARHWLAQVISAIDYLRQARIVHRDLKAENVMLNDKGVVKLIDFGTAKDLENPQIKGSGNASRSKVFEDYVGTPQFMPPEVIENKCTDFRSDTWSFGCLIFQILTGIPPFHGASEYLVFCRVQAMDLKFPPGISPAATDLIRRIIVENQDARLGAHDTQEWKQHEFFIGTQIKDAHLEPPPVLKLADICLRMIGSSQVEAMESAIEKWGKKEQLSPEIQEVLKRMAEVQKWADKAMPPQPDV